MRSVALWALFWIAFGCFLGACTTNQIRSEADASAPTDSGSMDDAAGLTDSGSTDVAASDAPVPDCSTTERDRRGQIALTQPIEPHASLGGVSLLGTSMAGMSLADVERVLCQGTDQGDVFGDGTQVMAWGPNLELALDYDPQSLQGRFFDTYSYAGTMTFKSADGVHAYSIGLARQITKDGQPFVIDWASNIEAAADELYRGMLATFVPSASPPMLNSTCVAAGGCAYRIYGKLGELSFGIIGFTLVVSDVTASQPAPSTPGRMQVFGPPYQ